MYLSEKKVDAREIFVCLQLVACNPLDIIIIDAGRIDSKFNFTDT